jgi:leucyl-tRNA synthetase
MGGTGSVFEQSWPTFDELAAAEDVVTIAVQINGKLRGEVEVERGADQDAVLELALADERIQRHMEGNSVRKVIHVPDRILNLVVG